MASETIPTSSPHYRYGGEHYYEPYYGGTMAELVKERSREKRRMLVMEAFRRRTWRERWREQQRVRSLVHMARRAMRTAIRVQPVSAVERWRRNRLLHRMERTGKRMSDITRPGQFSS